MSVDRLWHWLCDWCGVEVQREEYGLPKGWTHHVGPPPRRGTVHACTECKPKALAGDAPAHLSAAARERR